MNPKLDFMRIIERSDLSTERRKKYQRTLEEYLFITQNDLINRLVIYMMMMKE